MRGSKGGIVSIFSKETKSPTRIVRDIFALYFWGRSLTDTITTLRNTECMTSFTTFDEVCADARLEGEDEEDGGDIADSLDEEEDLEDEVEE